MFAAVRWSTNSTREFVEVTEILYKNGGNRFGSKFQYVLFIPPLYRTHESPFTTPPTHPPSLSISHGGPR